MTRFHRPLLIVGLAHFAGFVIALAAMAVDDRQILGIDPWIKPAKFLISVGIYLITIAWMVPRVRGHERARQIIAWGVLIALVTEIVCITMQAYRGVTSHFNHATAFDDAVFSVMGIMIFINTSLIAWLLMLFLKSPEPMSPAVLSGIRLGLVLFLVGSLEGGMMVAADAHAVGVPDGGPGLPFVNWSVEGGDLRAAHFVGLHALQVLPILGAFASRATVRIAAAGWVGLFAGLTWLALAGRPLFSA